LSGIDNLLEYARILAYQS